MNPEKNGIDQKVRIKLFVLIRRTVRPNKTEMPHNYRTGYGRGTVVRYYGRVRKAVGYPVSIPRKRRRVMQKRYGGVNYMEKKQANRSTINATPFIGAINAEISPQVLAQVGTGDFERIGAQMTIRSFGVNFSITAQTTTLVPNIMRVIILWDRQPNGSQFITTDLLDPPQTPLSFGNLDRRYRFKTIWNSGVFSMGKFGGGNTPENRTWSVYFPCNLGMMYQGNLGDVASVSSGLLYIVIISDATDAPAAHSVDFVTRGRFTDGYSKGESVGKVSVKGWDYPS